MIRCFALIDCPLCVCIECLRSSVGYSNHKVFIEYSPVSGKIEYAECEASTCSVSNICREDFIRRWNNAIPAYTKDLCDELSFDEEHFRKLIRCFIFGHAAPSAFRY